MRTCASATRHALRSVEICPEVFEMRGDVAVAKIEVVPEEYGQSCQEAADSCPVEAILIEE